MKPYQLSDELEKFLHDQSTVGSAAWNRLFDETMAGLEFEVNGEALNLEATLNLLTEQDRSKREAATHALAAVFQDNIKIFARVHNTLAKEKEPGGTCPTTSKPKWLRPCATRSSRPTRACPTAIMR